MNVYVFADLEGITGIYTKAQVLSDGAKYAEGRDYMTHDMNVVAAALKEAGVEKVYVRDGHGGGITARWEQISGDVDYFIEGTTRTRFPGLEDCDAVILLGYHAMAGTEEAILEHSMSSTSIQNYWINGVKSGELAIDAGIVGELGKPVIMVSGDDKCCAEARRMIPGVVTAEVKKGCSSFGGMLLPRPKADALLREKVLEAVAKAKDIKPVVYETPVRFRVENMERVNTPWPGVKPYLTILDGRTFEVTGDSMAQALERSH